MSRDNTEKALYQHLIDNLPTGVSVADVAWKNPEEPFEPANRQMWIEPAVIESSSNTTGKAKSDSDIQKGYMQIDVYVPTKSSTYDAALTTAIDEISSAFKFGTELVYNNQKVSIQSNNSPNSEEDGPYYRRVITIKFLTVSTRV